MNLGIKNKPVLKKRMVYCTGTTALLKGQGLCFDLDYLTTATGETAADAFGLRGNAVALPDNTNNGAFAGVTLADHAAHADGSAIGWIEIAEPGSRVEILALANTTINSTRLTCLAGSGAPGRFWTAGLPGRGTALALQTKTAVLKTLSTGAGALDATGKIITTSGITASGLAIGDKVWVFGIEDDGTNSGTPGIYTVSAVADTTITVSEAISDGGTMQCSYVAFEGDPYVFAELCEGEESGLIEVVAPPSPGDDSTPAFTVMSGGKTFIAGGYTIATGDQVAVWPAGQYIGQKKAFEGLGTLGTKDAKLVPAASGWQATVVDVILDNGAADGKPMALVSVNIDAASEVIVGEWVGVWRELYHTGAVIAAS